MCWITIFLLVLVVNGFCPKQISVRKVNLDYRVQLALLHAKGAVCNEKALLKMSKLNLIETVKGVLDY